MNPPLPFSVSGLGRLADACLGLLMLACLTWAIFPAQASGQGIPLSTWSEPPPPTSKPWDYAAEPSSGSSSYTTGNGGTVYAATAPANPVYLVQNSSANIINLAANLDKDPIKIYEWVRNNVHTEYYVGCRRGAHLTLIERAGNDVDQCALLGLLLKAAGYTPNYMSGRLTIPRTATGSNQVGVYEWLGVNSDARAIALLAPHGPDSAFVNNSLTIDYMWLSVAVSSQRTLVFAPSIKPHNFGRKPDLAALSNYSLTAARTAANALTQGTYNGITQPGDYSSLIDRAGLRAYLNGRAATASNNIRNSSTDHDLDGADLARLRMIVPEVVSVTSPTATKFPDGLTYDSAAAVFTGVPTTFASRLEINVYYSSSFSTRLTVTLENTRRRYELRFDAYGNATLWQDDLPVYPLENDNPASNAIIVGYKFFPPSAYYGGASSPIEVVSNILPRVAPITFLYSFGRTLGRLQEWQETLAKREAAGTALGYADRQQLLALQYASQLYELNSVAAASLDCEYRQDLMLGFVFQSNGKPVIDIPMISSSCLSRTDAGNSSEIAAGRTLTLLASALEGTSTQQLTGSRAYGTATLFDSVSDHAFLLDHTNVDSPPSGIRDFSDDTLGPGTIQFIKDFVKSPNSGNKVFILKNSKVSINDVNFSGFYLIGGSDNVVGTLIRGNFGGVATAGFNTTTPYGPNIANAETHATFTKPAITSPKSTDPVDLTNGAFLKNDTDLVVGNEGEPNGLKLVRNYNSARRLVDPTGLGRGWTHSYDLRLTTRTPSDFDMQRASVDEVLPVILAARMTRDALDTGTPYASEARGWLMASTAVTWAADQQLNTRASVTLGDRAMEFVLRPDNITYAPPSGLPVTLAKNGDGSHDLAFRHGNTIHFRSSDGKFETIKDQFNNTLTAAYDGNGQLQRVTDAYARFFAFHYDGTTRRLTHVDDSTGRTVQYGREGSNFTFTDAEGGTARYQMDGDYRLTQINDARDREIVRNTYNDFHQVTEQRTLGDTGRLTKIWIAPGVGTEVDPLGNKVWTYIDSRGRKIFVADQLGKLSQWHYDGVDRLTETVTAKGFINSFVYDKNHVLVSETNPAGHVRTITPDAQSRPSVVRNFEGQETTFAYTAQHKVATITAPGGIVSNFTYDTRGRIATAHPASYAAGAVMTNAYDAFGHIDTITHPGGGLDNHTYTARGDLSELIDRKGAKISFAYNNRRQPTSATQWEGATPRTSQTFYDATGDVDYTLDASGRKVDSDHDALGHLTEVKRGPAGSQVVTLTHSYSDPRTLLTASTDALGNAVNYTYSATQQVATVKDPLNRTATLGYDEDQRRTTSQTPLGFVTTSILDSRGLQDGVQDAENQLTDYTYDKDGRMTVLANRLNKAFGWSYNDPARTITATTPTGKTTTTVASTRGLPATVTEPSGQQTSFTTYDAEGRLLQKTDSVGTTTYTYWPNGLPKQVTENGRTTYREYDSLNRLSRYDDGEGNTLNYTYYPSGELATIVYPGNKTVTYAYDDFGRLWHVTDWSNRVTTYTYDNASRLTRIDRPNGTYRTQEYDAASQLTLIREYTSGGALLVRQELRYDLDGRITYNFIHPKPASVTLASDDLLYDDDNQLSTWNGNNVIFDADGNMTNGPLPSGAFGAHGYDSRNRLTSAGGNNYRYSPDGLRVEITGTGAATFVIDPNAALSRTLMRTKGGTTTYYIYGLGLLYEETSGAPKYYHFDQVGSMLAMTDASQTVTDRASYAPYGTVTSRTGATDTPFQFNGEMGVQTDASGLYYMRARYYNPRLMRFCNADPIGFGGGMNWYAAFGNNPVSNTDPLGLWNTLGHNSILVEAFSPTGAAPFNLTPAEGAILRAASVRVDQDQGTANSFMHAMRAPGQTVAQAAALYDGFLADRQTQAVALARAGDRAGALNVLGEGMHALMDSTSPAHEGFQEWAGLGGPLGGAVNKAKAAAHASQESWPMGEPRTRAIDRIREYYEQFLNAVTPPNPNATATNPNPASNEPNPSTSQPSRK